MIVLKSIGTLVFVCITLITLAIISLAIWFVGYVAEEVAGKDEGIFHKIGAAIFI